MMLKLPMKLGVRGEIRWFAYDENDNRIPVKTTDGRELWGGHVQKNLITNLGMDAMPGFQNQAGWGQNQGANINNDYTFGIRQTLHIGTGSTVPAFTDTALVAQVQSGVNTGGFPANVLFTSATDYAGTPPTMTAAHRINHVITMTADRNLTEYGYSKANAAALNIRELFRDEFDVPITISLLNGTKLRVEHTWFTTFDLSRTTATFTIESYDVGGALVATDDITAEWGLSIISDSGAPTDGFAVLQTVSNTLVGSINQTIGAFRYHPSANPAIPATFVQNGAATNADTTGVDPFSLSWDGYIPGSYERTMRINVAEPVGNSTFYGWRFAYGTGAFGRYGYMFNVCFRGGASFAKANTHTLQVGIVGTWART